MKNKGRSRHIFLFVGLLSLLCQTEAAILDDLQNLLDQSDFRNNFDEMMTDIQTSEKWEALDVSFFENLPTERLKTIMRNGRNLAERTKAQLKSQLAKLETNVDSIHNQMRSSTTTDSELLNLAQNIQQPDTWNEAFVDKIGTEPFKKLNNAYLLKIQDENAIKRMIDKVEALRNSESNPMRKKKFEDLHNNFVAKLAKDAETWREVDARKFPINKMTPEIVNKLKPSVAALMNQSLSQEARARNGCKFGRSVVKKLMQGKLNEQSNYVEFGIFFDQLGRDLQKYVFPEDLMGEIRYVEVIEGYLRSNVRNCLEKGEVTPKSRSLYRLDYDTTVTSRILSSEGPCKVALMTLSAVNSSLEYLNEASTRELDKCITGADQNAKRISMMVHHENKQPLSRNMVYSNLPNSLLSFGTRFGGTSDSEAVNIARKEGIPLTDEQMEKLIIKVNPGSLSSLSPMAKAGMPLSKIKEVSLNELANNAESMTGQSLPCVTAAMRIFGSRTKISLQMLRQNKKLLKCMSRMDAKKIDTNSTPFEITRQLKNERMSTSLAMELRDRLVNATTGPNNKRSAMSKLSKSDIENMSVHVLAAFGSDLESLKEDEREYLLMKMGKMDEISEIPVASRKRIVKRGLQSRKRGDSLYPGDVDLVGQAYMMIPPNMLKNADENTKKIFLDRVNADIKAGKLNIFCITAGMTDAIANSISDVYGSPNKLDSMDGIDCLMWAPSWSYLQSISKEVLDDASCKLPQVTYSTGETAEANCLEANGLYYMNPLRMEKQLGIMRKKSLVSVLEREVDRGTLRNSKTLGLSYCEKGAILGVDTMNSGELGRMNDEDVIECMQYLGMMDMSRSRAKAYISDKLLRKRNNNPEQITEEDVVKIGSGFKGFDRDQISRMKGSMFRPSKEAMRSIGKLNLNIDQVKAVASKIKRNINSLSTLNGRNLVSIGNIICGFSMQDLKQIPYQSVQDAMPMLKRLECGDNNMNKAIQSLLERVYGSSENCDVAEMRDMGVLAAKMNSDYYSKIKPDAFAGITPMAMKKMNNAQLQKMDARGLENLQYETAAAITSAQINSLGEAQQKSVRIARNLNSATAEMTASVMFVILSIIFSYFL